MLGKPVLTVIAVHSGVLALLIKHQIQFKAYPLENSNILITVLLFIVLSYLHWIGNRNSLDSVDTLTVSSTGKKMKSLLIRYVILSLLGVFLAMAHAQDFENPDLTLTSSPFRCSHEYKHEESCLADPDHGCEWCQGYGLPGICVSEAEAKHWIHKIPHVRCAQTKESTTKKEDQRSFLRAARIWEPYDPKCLNAPSNASNGDDDDDDDDDASEICDSTMDSQGEMCVWCDGAGVFGLCLSHEQAVKASNFLQCDLAA